MSIERRDIRSPESPPPLISRPKSASQTQFDGSRKNSESNLGRNLFVATPQRAKPAQLHSSKERNGESAPAIVKLPGEEAQLGASSSRDEKPEAIVGI